MIRKGLSIILGVATATVGVAPLAPLLGAPARGGGGGTHGALFLERGSINRPITQLYATECDCIKSATPQLQTV